MLLIEILSKAAPFIIDEITGDYFSADFKVNDRLISFIASRIDDAPDRNAGDIWELEFSELGKNGDLNSHKLTGKGGEFVVFATLKKIIETFVDNFKPKKMTFTANKAEPSRVSAYEKMFSRFKIPNYTFSKDAESNTYQEFKLVRNDLKEVLNSTVDFTVVKSTNDLFKVIFSVHGKKYTFSASLEQFDDGQDFWDVSFSLGTEKTGSTFGISKTGNEFEVFATVKDILKEFISRYDPQYIKFTADEPSRIKLYGTMLKKFTPPNFNFQNNKDHETGGREFILAKK